MLLDALSPSSPEKPGWGVGLVTNNSALTFLSTKHTGSAVNPLSFKVFNAEKGYFDVMPSAHQQPMM